MKPLSSVLSRNDRQPDGLHGSARWYGLRAVALAAVATAIFAFGIVDGRSKPARAGYQDTDPQKSFVPDSASHPEVVATYERTLAGLDRRLIALANLVFEDADSARHMHKQVGDLQFEVQKAESAYQSAKLAREIAEIVHKEYRLGTSVQDQAVAEGELSLAKSEVERARRRTAEARQRLARITALTDNSALGLNLDYVYTDRLDAAELLEKQAALGLEQAESKKKVLAEFTIPKRMMELQSEVAKTKADELARQATWELETSKLKKAEDTYKAWNLPDDKKRIIALIDDAIPIEEQIRAKLAEARQGPQFPSSTATEIARLTQELAAVVDRAESLRDAGDFGRLKPRIQQIARRYKAATSK